MTWLFCYGPDGRLGGGERERTEGKVRTRMTYDTPAVDLSAVIKMVEKGKEIGYQNLQYVFHLNTHAILYSSCGTIEKAVLITRY